MKRLHELRGDAAALALALDHLYLTCEVLAVEEGEDHARVLVEGDLVALDDFAVTSTVVMELDGTSEGVAPTGFENDTVIEVGPDLIVRPPWVPAPTNFCGIELVVPRGMAFGSGEHGSTQAAMHALRAVWPMDQSPRVLDVGTGSGILLLLAQALGARELAGCDIEPESIAAARELLPHADLRLGGPQTFAGDLFDVVIANLDARQLRAHLAAVRARLRPGGMLVVSGMRPAEVAPLHDVLPSAARRMQRVESGDFVAIGYVGPTPLRGVGA